MKTLRTIIKLVEEYAVAFICVIFLDQVIYEISPWYGLDDKWMYYALAAVLMGIIKALDFITNKKKEVELI